MALKSDHKFLTYTLHDEAGILFEKHVTIPLLTIMYNGIQNHKRRKQLRSIFCPDLNIKLLTYNSK